MSHLFVNSTTTNYSLQCRGQGRHPERLWLCRNDSRAIPACAQSPLTVRSASSEAQGCPGSPSLLQQLAQLQSTAMGAASTCLQTGMVPHGLEKRWLRAYGRYWIHPMPLINKVMQGDVRAVPLTWIHRWALFGGLDSPCPRGAAGLCAMQQLLPCSHPQLHSQLPAQLKGCNPTLRCTSTGMGLGCGPKFIPQERGCLVLMVLFSKGSTTAHQAVLGTSHSLGDRNQCPDWSRKKKRADFAPRSFAH